MNSSFFQVDAFTSIPFHGNPAAVVPLNSWVEDRALQQIALENNLSETAFLAPTGDQGVDYELRWFTPACEVNLCGHATLASAHVLWQHLGFVRDEIVFSTRSGPVRVRQDPPRFVLDFPAIKMVEVKVTDEVTRALGLAPEFALIAAEGAIEAGGFMAVFRSEDEIRALEPDLNAIRSFPPRGCAIVTAPAEDDDIDFVSRFFAPGSGIDEDPVTGSAHCALTPYWAERLDRHELHARQISARGGELHLRNCGERVEIGGEAVTVIRGTLMIPT